MKLKNIHLSTLQINRSAPLQNSIRHKRVDENRKIVQINQVIQSVLAMGRMQKMELLTINNRSLNKRGKILRNEWLAKKHKTSEDSFLPDIQNLQINYRSQRKKNNNNKNKKKLICRNIKTDQNLDKLIDQQIEKIKQKGLLQGQYNRKTIIQDACEGIKRRIKSNQKVQTRDKSPRQQTNFRVYRKKSNKSNQSNKRAVTEAIYNQLISYINKKDQVANKLRQRKKIDFQKKIKKFSYTHIQN